MRSRFRGEDAEDVDAMERGVRPMQPNNDATALNLELGSIHGSMRALIPKPNSDDGIG
ncbi:MAG: hypothetical protein AAGA56_10440 [Myxococcota bacterium]